jgi:hypothetical protein
LRVKVWRQLQSLGAVSLKNSVYVLPSRDDTREDFQWLLRTIVTEGGEATLVEARIVDGFTDQELEAMFQAARDADYQTIAEEARTLVASLDKPKRGKDPVPEAQTAVRRLRKRLTATFALDFFSASGREVADGLVSALEARLTAKPPDPEAAAPAATEAFKGRTWVTRQGVHVDRIACAWLIRRFIDKEATFKFVPGKNYTAVPGELRFDMFEAEYTHEGDRCSFEVLLERFRLDDPALVAIGEIVHDLDMKDQKFRREETSGIEKVVAGIAMAHKADHARIERGSALLDDLHHYFARKSPKGRRS